jgi:hypothetical protein
LKNNNSNHEQEETDRLISQLLIDDLQFIFVETVLSSTEKELDQLLCDNHTLEAVMNLPEGSEKDSWMTAIQAEFDVLQKNATFKEIGNHENSPYIINFMIILKQKSQNQREIL